MKFVVTMLLCIFSSLSFANHVVNVDGLSDEQKKSLAVEIAKSRLENQKQALIEGQAPAVEKVSQWVDLGKNLGLGLASAAKELGIAANEFVKTPVGKITAFIIIYKFVGKDIMRFAVGFMFFVVAGGTWLYAFRRICLMNEIIQTQELKENKIIKHKRVVYKNWKNDTDGVAVFLFFVTGVAISVTSLIIMVP